MASLHQRLFDATDGLATNAGYLVASCDPATFWWDYYDYDVEERWLDDGGTVESRPSTTAPPELVQRLRAVTAEHGVPCDLRACVPPRPSTPGLTRRTQSGYEAPWRPVPHRVTGRSPRVKPADALVWPALLEAGSSSGVCGPPRHPSLPRVMEWRKGVRA
jgi:hypothetical protein